MIIVVGLCGLPGSGKSSLARLLSTHLQTRAESCIVIEYDGLMSDSTIEAWQNARKEALQRFEKYLMQCLSSSSSSCKDDGSHDTFIIMDDNLYYRSMRREIYSRCVQFASSNKLLAEGKIAVGFCAVERAVEDCIEVDSKVSTKLNELTSAAIKRTTLMKIQFCTFASSQWRTNPSQRFLVMEF